MAWPSASRMRLTSLPSITGIPTRGPAVCRSIVLLRKRRKRARKSLLFFEKLVPICKSLCSNGVATSYDPRIPTAGWSQYESQSKKAQVHASFRYGGAGPEYLYDTEKPGLAVRLTSGGARRFMNSSPDSATRQKLLFWTRYVQVPLAESPRLHPEPRRRGEPGLTRRAFPQRRAHRGTGSTRPRTGRGNRLGETESARAGCD